MSQILVRDLAPELLEALKARAKRNRRSLQAEVKVILEKAEPLPRSPEERRKAFERLREWSDWARAQNEGLPQSDSTEIIRRAREGYRD